MPTFTVTHPLGVRYLQDRALPHVVCEERGANLVLLGAVLS